MIVDALPPSFTLILTEASLLVIGFVAEKYYVSRLATFSNAIALTIHILYREDPGFWPALYVDIALLLGIIGLFAYVSDNRLNAHYYDVTYLLYSSTNVGLIIAFSSFSFFLPLILGIITQFILYLIYDGDKLVHDGKYSGAVKRFHNQYHFEISDWEGHRQYDFSGWFR